MQFTADRDPCWQRFGKGRTRVERTRRLASLIDRKKKGKKEIAPIATFSAPGGKRKREDSGRRGRLFINHL